MNEKSSRREYRPPPEIPPLTPEERRRSEISATMSLLYLHYRYGWKADDIFTGEFSLLGKAYLRLFGDDGSTPKQKLERMVEKIPEIAVREFYKIKNIPYD